MIFRNWVLQNFPFLEDDFDALTDYELFCKMVEYMKKSLDKIKDYQAELNEFRSELDSYKEYFDNLDVQEEINNKLDEMAESGELADIIAQYLGLAGMLVYDTLQDMKLAENIANGSICETLGYNNVNDGGKAKYRVRTIINTDVPNDGNIVALYDNTLVAVLIDEDLINVKQFGAVGDGTTDDYTAFNNALTYCNNNKKSLYIPIGNYLISDTLYIDSNVKIIGENKYYTKLIPDSDLLSDPIIATNYSDNNQIQNITLENFAIKSSGERTEYTIKLLNANTTTIKNMMIYQEGTSSSIYHGILIDKNIGFSGTNFVTKIIDSRFSKCKLKMNSTDSYILHNELWGNGVDCAVELGNASNTSITNNEIVGGNVYGGIYITTSNEGLKITSNYFDGSYNEIDTKYGIYGSGLLKNSVISNNNFWKQKSGAIYLTQANLNLIANNVFEENDYYLTGHSDIEILENNQSFGNNIVNNNFIRTNYYNTVSGEVLQRPTTTPVPILKIYSKTGGYAGTIITNNNCIYEQFFGVIQATGFVVSNNNLSQKFYFENNLSVTDMKNDKQVYYHNNNNKLTNKGTCLLNNTEKRIDNIITYLNTQLENNFDYNATSSEEYRIYINNASTVSNKPDFASANALVIYIPIVSNTYAIQIVTCYSSNIGAIKYRMLNNGTWSNWQ